MTTFKLDYVGVGQLLRSPEMQAEMRRRAEKVRVAAEASAPVYLKGRHPGRYKRSFRVRAGRRPSRAYAMVINYSPEALWVEYGTKNNPRHRTLGRALEAARD
jgi:hypothetical protein